jgi:hypothetical protein
MEKTAAPVPAQDAEQLAHPLRCWICEIVVKLGAGDGDGAGDEAVLDKLPFPHPQNRVENNKMIPRTTATVSCLS